MTAAVVMFSLAYQQPVTRLALHDVMRQIIRQDMPRWKKTYTHCRILPKKKKKRGGRIVEVDFSFINGGG